MTNASFNSNYSCVIDEDPQNNHNHPGNLVFPTVLMLTSFFFFLRNKPCCPAFSLHHFFFYFTSPLMTPFPFLCLHLSSHLVFIQPQTPLVSSHPPPPCLSVCKVGFYRSLLESLACSKCPPHSMARQAGATACSCEDGYYKIDSDPPNMACTREGICIYDI